MAEKKPVIRLLFAKIKEAFYNLSEEEKMEIPPELDFSDSEYRERLKEVFKMHTGSHKRNFDYFIPVRPFPARLLDRQVGCAEFGEVGSHYLFAFGTGINGVPFVLFVEVQTDFSLTLQ